MEKRISRATLLKLIENLIKSKREQEERKGEAFSRAELLAAMNFEFIQLHINKRQNEEEEYYFSLLVKYKGSKEPIKINFNDHENTETTKNPQGVN